VAVAVPDRDVRSSRDVRHVVFPSAGPTSVWSLDTDV